MREPFFVAALRRGIEKVVSAHQDVESARIARIGVKYLASFIFEKTLSPGASSLGKVICS